MRYVTALLVILALVCVAAAMATWELRMLLSAMLYAFAALVSVLFWKH